MTLPDDVRLVLPEDAAQTWEVVAPVLPPDLYLAGGTGLAVHIQHRVSRDLDCFYHEAGVDLASLAQGLAAAGPFVVTEAASGTLTGLCSQTKLQFLHADEVEVQRRLEPTRLVGGIEVAGIGDEPFVIEPVVRALGYLGDVDEDDLVPATRDEIEAYWRRRQPEIVRSAARFAN